MGTTLDIAIGLVSVFFLLSVLSSAIYEALAGVFRLRALNLAQSIEIMLADRALDPHVLRSLAARDAAPHGAAPSEPIATRVLRRAADLVRVRLMPGPPPSPLADALRQHPLIKDLKYGWVGPSYIPSHAFVAALIDTLRHIDWPRSDAPSPPQAVAAAPSLAQAGAAPSPLLARAAPSIAATPAPAPAGDAAPAPAGDAASAPAPAGDAAPASPESAAEPSPPAIAGAPAPAPAGAAAAPPGGGAAPPSCDEAPLDELKGIIERMPRESDLRRALATIVDSTVRDMREANIRLERWFNDAMDRASGRYKRRAQLIISATALVLCIGFNADSIKLAGALSRDAVVRAHLIAAAQEMAKTAPRAAPHEGGMDQDEDLMAALAQGGSAHGKLTGLDLKIAWGVQAPEQTSAPRLWSALSAILGQAIVAWVRGVLDRLLSPGILITAAAASLGAPFWFDLLNKLVNLRTVGKSPEPYEPPKGAGPDTSVNR
ncbi:hypothetical protein [Sorangium cellulosum]|uniref:Uncharacterized protein n=1 Tax=Sorangium cellulosum So0157-2 TaxID=1254432 RepID=S4YBK5_SORCE|nr:hypothetical protein [Sorangium cellulosum]AGP40178.1 hypothetical protein SCE1572_40155 [Sorangium cellulosum So0157-2]